MGKSLILILLGASGVISLFKPWIGVVVAYLFVIMVPQDIWWWHFTGQRPVFIIMAFTLIGFSIYLINNISSLRIIIEKRYLLIIFLWAIYYLSYILGPYTNQESMYRWFEPTWMMSNINKMFLLFFIACICINDEIKLKAFVLIIVVASIYLTYWINDQYLFQGRFGRIGGPKSLTGFGVYTDENAFATFFVASIPFLYFIGYGINNKFIKYVLWSIIPLAWHSIFLTGSRGGLLGVIASLIYLVCRNEKKVYGIIIVIIFGIFFIWQAGDIMKSRAKTIDEYNTETSAKARLEAWQAAINMIKKHPITGVGLSSFGVAYPDFSDKKPREAHNSLLQISAESGIFAGLIYVLILFVAIKTGLQNRKKFKKRTIYKYLYNINEAALTSLIGLIVCSLFLTMNMSELFFYIIAILYIVKNITANDRAKI
jgi:probable O-glycosylation ligase (exosortase A-associated)